jgi:hypothetical protein
MKTSILEHRTTIQAVLRGVAWLLWVAVAFMTLYFGFLEYTERAGRGAFALGALFLGPPAMAFSGFAGAFGAFTRNDRVWGAAWSVLMILGIAGVVFIYFQFSNFKGGFGA